MIHQPEPLAQRRRQHPGARRRADQREALERQLERLRVGAAVDDEVDAEVFHRRIEILFDDPAEPVDLVDEQHVALIERGQDADEILRFLERRPRRAVQRSAEFLRDQVGQRRLSQTRRSREQDVFERFAAPLRGIDRDVQVLDDLSLPDVLFERPRPQRRAVDRVF